MPTRAMCRQETVGEREAEIRRVPLTAPRLGGKPPTNRPRQSILARRESTPCGEDGPQAYRGGRRNQPERAMAETPPAEQAKRADPPTAGRDEEDLLRLRALRLRERGELIETACEAAAAIYRSRLGSGLPDVQPAPWPESTWQFLRRHAARVRS